MTTQCVVYVLGTCRGFRIWFGRSVIREPALHLVTHSDGTGFPSWIVLYMKTATVEPCKMSSGYVMGNKMLVAGIKCLCIDDG